MYQLIHFPVLHVKMLLLLTLFLFSFWGEEGGRQAMLGGFSRDFFKLKLTFVFLHNLFDPAVPLKCCVEGRAMFLSSSFLMLRGR